MQFVPSFIIQWLKSQWHPKSWSFSGNFLVIHSLLFSMKTLFYKRTFWNYKGSYYCIYYRFYSHKIHWRIINHCHSQSTEPNSQSMNSGVWLELVSRGSAEKSLKQRTQKQALNQMCVCVHCSSLSDSLPPHGL